MASPKQRGLAALVSKTFADGQRLVTAQVTLAKAELKSTAQEAGKVGIFVAVAIGSITLFVIFLLVTLAYVLVEIGLPVWAGFGIVALFLMIVTIIAALLARAEAKKMNGPKVIVDEVQQTAKELEQTLGLPERSSTT
jgi:hypothetical protein